MKTKEIRDLIDFIAQTGLNEVNIETEELKISVKRQPEVTTKVVEATPLPTPQAQPANSATPQPTPQVQDKPTGAGEATTEDTSKYVEIKSPMIGTFYRSPSPEASAFVSVGDKVEKGQAVCIVEAMKLFNEIESEVSGTIVKVMVDNASPVEYDQVLFLVDPS